MIVRDAIAEPMNVEVYTSRTVATSRRSVYAETTPCPTQMYAAHAAASTLRCWCCGRLASGKA